MATVRTVAVVDIRISNNVTWSDEFQFGDDTDTSWDFNDKTFLLDIKTAPTDTTPALALNSTDGTLYVVDDTQRILGFNVTDVSLRANLPVAVYVYDLIMVDNLAVRTMLMSGSLTVTQGVTLED